MLVGGQPTVDGACDSNEDRRFSPVEFQAICALLGKQFDLDACANDDGCNAHVCKYCSPSDSFLEKSCAGMHVWCNPPFRRALQFLLHYFACKSRDPANTSGVFVLPKWQSAPWWPLVRHLQVLKEYGTGTRLFDAPGPSGERTTMPGTPWPVVVLYDPPRRVTEFGKVWAEPNMHPATPVVPTTAEKCKKDNPGCARLCIASGGLAPRMQVILRGTLAGHPANFLFDTETQAQTRLS